MSELLWILVALAWWTVGYVGCIWVWTYDFDVGTFELIVFAVFATCGPVIPIVWCLYSLHGDPNRIWIRRRR